MSFSKTTRHALFSFYAHTRAIQPRVRNAQFTLLFPDVVVISDLNKYIGGSTDLAKKTYGSGDLYTPIHLPPSSHTSSHTSPLFHLGFARVAV